MSESKKQRDRVILSIKRCIESQFSDFDWDELAYVTGGQANTPTPTLYHKI
jgi:hypothetical protein